MNKKILTKKLAEFFKKEKHIKMAYLFGSAARGKTGKLSDIDIGVFLNERLDKERAFELQLKLIDKLKLLLKTDRIDLVIMNDVSIPVNYEIIKANYPIYIKDKTKKLEFEYTIMSKYLDRRYYDKKASEIFLDKVSKHGLTF